MRDKLLEAATPCTGSPAVPNNLDPSHTKIVVVKENEKIDWPIENKNGSLKWTEFAGFLHGFGVVEEHFLGAPMPKFTGTAEADGKRGPYVAPLANVACDEGENEVVGLRVANLHYLDRGKHSLSIDCRAYDVSVFFLIRIIQAILSDLTTKGYSALTMIPGLQATAPHTISTVESEIDELIKALSRETKIGGVKSLVNIQKQAWFRTIPEEEWICYKFLEFERARKKGEKDRFLVLWKLVLTTETEITDMTTDVTGNGK
jgi:hypothetical protein